MGTGSSRGYSAPRTGRRLSPSRYVSHGKKKRRRGLFRKIRPTPTTQPVIPIKYHSSHPYPYGFRPYVPPIPVYARSSPPVYPNYMPIPYNNYAVSPYASLGQRYMIPPQQIQPIVLPQSQPFAMPQSQPFVLPQSQPLIMPQPIPQPQPMAMPQQVSPSVFSPYFTGVPMSMPYVQQQPQVGPYYYNNIGVSAPVSTGMPAPTGPYSSLYQGTRTRFNTDWTGGGKISPGFLGPPI